MDWIWVIVLGLVVGGIASLLVPGRTPGGMIGVFLLGLVGAVVARYIFDNVILVFITSIAAAAIAIVAASRLTSRA